MFPVHYRGNTNASITSETPDWLKTCFVPEARISCQKASIPNSVAARQLSCIPICSTPPESNMCAAYLPPNCTPIIRTMHRGTLCVNTSTNLCVQC